MVQVLANLRARKQAKLDQASRVAASGKLDQAQFIYNLLSDANTIHQIINDLEKSDSALFAGLY